MRFRKPIVTLLLILSFSAKGFGAGTNPCEALMDKAIKQFSNLNFLLHNKCHNDSNAQPIVVLPGGPSISGEYLDSISKEINSSICQPVFRLMLPNHELSRNMPDLKFNEVADLVTQALRAIENEYHKKAILIGHSFGALLIAKIIETKPELSSANILISPPVSLTNWSNFNRQLQEQGITTPQTFANEADFKDWWSRVTPIYFRHDPSDADLLKLTQKTYYEGTNRQTEKAPDFYQLFKKLSTAQHKLPSIYFILGKNEPLGPDGSNDILHSLFRSNVFFVKDVGHFPMLENKIETLRVLNYLIELNLRPTT